MAKKKAQATRKATTVKKVATAKKTKVVNKPTAEQAIAGLEASVRYDDFLERAESALEGLRNSPTAFDAVEPILRLMERNEDADFGTPGPFVHFVETFYRSGYEDKLLESIRRKPTSHTLWMLNRIVNDVRGKQKILYIAAMKDAAKRKDASKQARDLARVFLEEA